MKSKFSARLAAGAGVAALALALMAPVAQAETPAPGYGQFAGCPSYKTENPNITTCITSTITGGNLHLGNKETKITNPITLSGGLNEESEEFSFNSNGGLTKAKQKVEGGVIGLTGLTWLAEYLGSDALTLYATAELAGQVQVNNVEDIVLPLKVHLENSTGVLGPSCYIGSNSDPINLHLVTGTSGKLTGKAPTYKFDPETEIVKGSNGTFVDGTFTAPGANGCTLNLFGFIPISLNGVIDLASGLPASSGNYTSQNYNIEIVESELVYP
ncbi:MAG TPA: hypothetical protein VHO06_21000 [Polyangia bacterium]|nr:hypothetical protein [Polyangia bacterium]